MGEYHRNIRQFDQNFIETLLTFFISNKSLLREPKTLDIKTTFAKRETIFGNLFTFSRPMVAAQLSSQQHTLKDKSIELVSKELNHFGVIADLFRQIGGHSSGFVLFCSF